MSDNYVLFLLYKQPEVFTECHFHLLRYLATREEKSAEQITYLIYTDQPAQFDRWKNTDLHLEIIPTPFEQINGWFGPQRYQYRAKIVAIKDALKRTGGNVLYCDTDTYPRKDLCAVFKRLEVGELFMYENEGCIDKAVCPDFFRYHERFAAKPTLNVGSSTCAIPLTTQVWNSGVVGIGHIQAPIVDEVLAFCDSLYKEWPHFAVEQFAFGYVCQYSLKGCNAAKDYVYHYWSVRRYALLLDRLFELCGQGDVDRLMRASERILAEDLAPIKDRWEQSRWDALWPFPFVWRKYPYARELLLRFRKRQWAIEQQFSRLNSLD